METHETEHLIEAQSEHGEEHQSSKVRVCRFGDHVVEAGAHELRRCASNSGSSAAFASMAAPSAGGAVLAMGPHPRGEGAGVCVLLGVARAQVLERRIAQSGQQGLLAGVVVDHPALRKGGLCRHGFDGEVRSARSVTMRRAASDARPVIDSLPAAMALSAVLTVSTVKQRPMWMSTGRSVRSSELRFMLRRLTGRKRGGVCSTCRTTYWTVERVGRQQRCWCSTVAVAHACLPGLRTGSRLLRGRWAAP